MSYVEVPTNVPETERYVADHLGLLIAPLHAADGELLGVLSTEGPVDIAHPPAGTCELVELYAEQARLALTGLRRQDVLTERLRMSYAAQGDAPGRRCRGERAVAAGVGGRRARGDDARAWCLGLRRARARCPRRGRVVPARRSPSGSGTDVCTLLEPMIGTCLSDETTLTDESAPLLGRLAAVTGHEQALLAAIGDGTGSRGALLVLRRAEDEPWTDSDREAVFALGRRLGTVADQVKGRRRDQEIVEELMRLDEYRRDLVASITHDLKTPLTAIALNTELLESDRRLAEAGSHPVGGDPPERRPAVQPGRRPPRDGPRRGGRRQPHEVDLVQMVRDACGHAETEARCVGSPSTSTRPRNCGRRSTRTLWRGSSPTWWRTRSSSACRAAASYCVSSGIGGASWSSGAADEGIGIPEDLLETIFDIVTSYSGRAHRGVPGLRDRPGDLRPHRHPPRRTDHGGRRRRGRDRRSPCASPADRLDRPAARASAQTGLGDQPSGEAVGRDAPGQQVDPGVERQTTSVIARTPTSNRWNGRGSRSRVAPCRWAIHPPRALVTTALITLAIAAPRIVPSSPSWLERAVAVAAATAPATTVG